VETSSCVDFHRKFFSPVGGGVPARVAGVRLAFSFSVSGSRLCRLSLSPSGSYTQEQGGALKFFSTGNLFSQRWLFPPVFVNSSSTTRVRHCWSRSQAHCRRNRFPLPLVRSSTPEARHPRCGLLLNLSTCCVLPQLKSIQVSTFASGLDVWIVAGTHPGCVHESSDQKTRGFVVQIALPRRFLERAHQVFGEMLVRI
jgi:hypothetical protein